MEKGEQAGDSHRPTSWPLVKPLPPRQFGIGDNVDKARGAAQRARNEPKDV